MENADSDTLYIVQRFTPDEFFTAQQRQRLRQLMDKLHDMEAGIGKLSVDEQTELENLVEAELDGVARRCAKIAELAR